MTPRPDPRHFRGQRVLLVGLGLHGGGVATARWLVRSGARVRVTDLKTASALRPSAKALAGLPVILHLGGHQPADFRWADRIVVNPDVRSTQADVRAAAKRGVRIDNEASLFVERFRGRLIGVTGTRGKTTTTLLLGAILKRAHPRTIVSGNVRAVPMLAYLPRTGVDSWAVLELSSYQLERLPVPGHAFDVAVMTNLMVDHLSRHGTMEAYARVKFRLFHGQSADQVAVLNAENRFCRRVARGSRARIVWFGRSRLPVKGGTTVQAGWVVEQFDGTTRKLFPVSDWRLAGEHNLMNMLAAVTAARAMGIAQATIRTAIRTFRPVPFRQQLVRTVGGHRYVNDTTATSPDGSLAAMAVFPRAIFILGGADKELDYRPLAQHMTAQNIPAVFLPGSGTKVLQAHLRRYRYRRPLITVASMRSAVRVARDLATRGQSIVLSPGAASFGLFQHEFDRGRQFNREVRRVV